MVPTALFPVAGFAVIVLAGQVLTLADRTAELVTPVAVALALASLGTRPAARRLAVGPRGPSPLVAAQPALPVGSYLWAGSGSSRPRP